MENQNCNEQKLLISYMTLRKAVGILGIFLPLALLAGNYFIGNCCQVQSSISHYYYTVVGDLFVGTMCAIALFLMTYKGYNNIDHFATTLAGMFALLVAFFPTNEWSGCLCINPHRTLDNSTLRNAIHLTSASLFFITLSLISIFLFTKSTGHKTKEKKTRNKIYVACGIIMLFSIALIASVMLLPSPLKENLETYRPVFILEWVALLAFGSSWLVKGEFILKDKE